MTGLIHEVIPLKLFLHMVPSSSADNVTTHVVRMLRCVADEYVCKAAQTVHESKIRVTVSDLKIT